MKIMIIDLVFASGDLRIRTRDTPAVRHAVDLARAVLALGDDGRLTVRKTTKRLREVEFDNQYGVAEAVEALMRYTASRETEEGLAMLVRRGGSRGFAQRAAGAALREPMKHAAKTGLAGMALLLSIAVSVSAGPLEDADAAYQRGDYATALELLRPLADHGDVHAQVGLGAMYLRGVGVSQDDTKAAWFFREAAEQGDASAEANVGAMYARGRGVPQDYVKAYMWFTLAAVHYQPGAERMAALQNRNLVATQLTPMQIAEAQRLAREWRRK